MDFISYFEWLLNSHIFRHPHDSNGLLFDDKFTYNLMKLAKVRTLSSGSTEHALLKKYI